MLYELLYFSKEKPIIKDNKFVTDSFFIPQGFVHTIYLLMTLLGVKSSTTYQDSNDIKFVKDGILLTQLDQPLWQRFPTFSPCDNHQVLRNPNANVITFFL